MARQVINIGSATYAGDGESLRSAFDKINNNFNELYDSDITTSTITKDLKGSVFSDDSTLMIDGTSGRITSNALSQNGATSGQVLAWNSVAEEWRPSDVSLAGGNITGDLKGSVFADDSTVLVDAVGGTIPAANLTGTATINITGDVTGDLTGDVTGDLTGDVNGDVTGNVTGDIKGSVFADDSSLIVDSINSLVTADLTGNVTGDVKGSVFADDSTLLVDGVNGKVLSANLEGALPAIEGDAITVNGTAIQSTINTISAALAIGLS